MIFGILKVVVISLIVIFILHRIILYIKTMYVDTTLASSVLQDSKKMYEDIAKTISNPINKSDKPDKKEKKKVEIDERHNSVRLIPSRSEDQNANIKALSFPSAEGIHTSAIVNMKNELAEFMDTLSQ